MEQSTAIGARRPQRKRRSAKGTLVRIAGEVGVALVALIIVVGTAVALPVWLSRSYGIGLTAVIVIASIVVLAFRSGPRRRRRPHGRM